MRHSSGGREFLVAGGSQGIDSHSFEMKGLSVPLTLCSVAMCGEDMGGTAS